MSGRMVARPAADLPNQPIAHEHLVLETEDGIRVGFVDPRRFGSVDLVPTAAEDGAPAAGRAGAGAAGGGIHPGGADRGPGGRSRPRSRRRCWTRRWSPASATSMSARRCSAPGISPRRLAAQRRRGAQPRGWCRRSRRCWRRASRPAAPPCATMSRRMAGSASSRNASGSMTARACPAGLPRPAGLRGHPPHRPGRPGTFHCPRLQR